jgi:hypothetical protein
MRRLNRFRLARKFWSGKQKKSPTLSKKFLICSFRFDTRTKSTPELRPSGISRRAFLFWRYVVGGQPDWRFVGSVLWPWAAILAVLQAVKRGGKRQSKAVKSGQAGELCPVCGLFERQLSVIWGLYARVAPGLCQVCAAARVGVMVEKGRVRAPFRGGESPGFRVFRRSFLGASARPCGGGSRSH